MIKVPQRRLGLMERLSWPESKRLSASAAKALMEISFQNEDVDRMNVLSVKAQSGSLTSEEQRELDEYEVVSHLLSIMHLKARRALKQHRSVS